MLAYTGACSLVASFLNVNYPIHKSPKTNYINETQ